MNAPRRLLATALTLGLVAGLLVASAPAASAAVFTVTSTADALVPPPGSLRQAILDANLTPAADTITFSVTGQITLAGTLPLISGPLTINGPGANLLTISGNDLFQVLSVLPGVPLTLDGLTIANGSATFGGAIFNRGTVTILNSILSDNSATAEGGAIYNQDNADGATLTIIDSTLSGNTADSGGGSGGAIANSFFDNGCTVTITGSTLSGNSAADSGGGIFNYKGSLTIIDSELSDNTASNFYGGGIYSFLGTLAVTDSTLSDNTAYFGGGIRNEGTATITNSTLSDNTATNTGGGIHTNGTLVITDSTLSDNTATVNGGAIFNGAVLTITNATLSDNTAHRDGGGIYNFLGTLDVTNSTISGNTAVFYGGGIYNFLGTLDVTNSTISGNTAAYGGGIYSGGGANGAIIPITQGSNHAPGTHILGTTFEANEAACDGGGIHNSGGLQITNSTFYANEASGFGGGLFNGGGAVATTAVASIGAPVVVQAQAEITNATFSQNSAFGEVGTGPNASGGSPSGDGLVFACRVLQQQAQQVALAAGGGIFNADVVLTGGATQPLPLDTLVLKGTLLDHAGAGGDCSGPITDSGFNMDSDDSCQLQDSSFPSMDPDLQDLADNGGPTQTMALRPHSPALDKIPTGVCEHFLGHSPTDQRGVVRPQGEACDIGAFELEAEGTQPPPPPHPRWVEQTTIELAGPFGPVSVQVLVPSGGDGSTFKLKGTLHARHWFCRHRSRVNLILVGQGTIDHTFTNGAGEFSFVTSLPGGVSQASFKAKFPTKKGAPGTCKSSVSDPLLVSG